MKKLSVLTRIKAEHYIINVLTNVKNKLENCAMENRTVKTDVEKTATTKVAYDRLTH